MTWLSPDAIVERGFARSRVVMMNEGHNGLVRCPRTRRVGKAILPTAHAAGCRYLALEALWNRRPGATFVSAHDGSGYLEQPEMRELVDAALALGWKLVAYECNPDHVPPGMLDNPMTTEFANWRERRQAENLAAAVAHLDAKLLVWCGNSHHLKISRSDWVPMGVHFVELVGDAFCIDQLATVSLAPEHRPFRTVTPELAAMLDAFGGTAGFVCDAPPAGYTAPEGWDAMVLSTDNAVI